MSYSFVRKVWLCLNLIISSSFLNSAFCTDSVVAPNPPYKLRKFRPQSATLPKASHFASAVDKEVEKSSLSAPSSYRRLKLGDGLSKSNISRESRLYFHPIVLGIASKRFTLERAGMNLSYINAKIHGFVQKILHEEKKNEKLNEKLTEMRQASSPPQHTKLLLTFFNGLNLNQQETFIKEANDLEDISVRQPRNYLATKLSAPSEMNLMALRIQIAGLYRGDFGYPKDERQAQSIYALYKRQFGIRLWNFMDGLRFLRE